MSTSVSNSSLYKYGVFLQKYGIVSDNWKENKSEYELVQNVAQIASTIKRRIPIPEKAKEVIKLYKPELAHKIDLNRKIIESATDLYIYYPANWVSQTITTLKQNNSLPLDWQKDPESLSYIQTILDDVQTNIHKYSSISRAIRAAIKRNPQTTNPQPQMALNTNKPQPEQLTLADVEPNLFQNISNHHNDFEFEIVDTLTNQIVTTPNQIETSTNTSKYNQPSIEDLYSVALEIRDLLKTLVQTIENNNLNRNK